MSLRADQSLAIGAAMLARAFDHELRDVLGDHGVAPGQLGVLLALYERDGQTQAELARATSTRQPTMAGTLQRMERDGLVRRRRAPDDGRAVAVHLTDRAIDLERPLTDAARAVNRRAVRGLSADERAHLYGLVRRVRENLEAG